jgi:diguanylate cyclase (GGDEF)-like protein
MLAKTPGLRVEAAGLRVGAALRPAAERRISVAVAGRAHPLGEVVASVPFDEMLVRRLRRSAALEPGHRVAVAHHGRIVVGPPGHVRASTGPTALKLGNGSYRGLSSEPLRNARSTSLVVLMSQRAIDAAQSTSQRRLLLALLAVLLLVGAFAYLEGRAIVRSVGRLLGAADAIARGELDRRVPVSGGDELATLARSFNAMADQLAHRMEELESERERLEGAMRLFGEALAATHDVEELLRVVLDAEIEATGATGGMVVADGRVAAEVGAPNGGARIELPLRAGDASFGRLVLTGTEFDEDAEKTAKSLAGHAAIALENARLHRIVSKQATVDELTGLANRRYAGEMLAREIARAERFGDPLAFVLCDLDNFKQVNDRHGHLCGDDVLRELASVLIDVVRSTDIAARWGGEEFALILPGTDVDGATHVADRAREALESRTLLTPEGDQVRVTASFGVAAFRDQGQGDELVATADLALYTAKRLGKNRVEARSAPVNR